VSQHHNIKLHALAEHLVQTGVLLDPGMRDGSQAVDGIAGDALDGHPVDGQPVDGHPVDGLDGRARPGATRPMQEAEDPQA
jgi:hypothetical protein